jgi:hypothetical protein
MPTSSQIPKYAADLIDLYHEPDRCVLGTAVFYERVEPGADLRQVALRHYRYLVGKSEEEFANSNWLRPWKLVYQRTPDLEPTIFCELDVAARLSDIAYEDRLENMLDLYWPDGYIAAKQVLEPAFDVPEVETFQVYAIGDGEVIEGLLILGSRANGETITLAFLDD